MKGHFDHKNILVMTVSNFLQLSTYDKHFILNIASCNFVVMIHMTQYTAYNVTVCMCIGNH